MASVIAPEDVISPPQQTPELTFEDSSVTYYSSLVSVKHLFPSCIPGHIMGIEILLGQQL